MKKFYLTMALVASLAVSGCAVLDSHNVIGRSTPVPETFEPLNFKQRQEVVDQVWNTVNTRYIDPKLNGVDWAAVRSAYAQKFTPTQDEESFWDTLDQMVGELSDSHTRVESPRRVRERAMFGGFTYGLTLAWIERQVVVIAVHPDSDAWFAGVRAGSVVDSINGAPATQQFDQSLANTRKHSTKWIQERQAFRRMLEAKEKGTLEIRVRRDDDSVITATLKPRVARTAPSQSARVLPSGFGYLRFSGFYESLRSGVLAGFAELKDTPGLIIDLRGNGGGSADMARAIVQLFVEKDVQPVKVVTRNDVPVRVLGFAVAGSEIKTKPGGDKAYKKPIVVLTDINSASASELTSAALREIGNTTVVGQTTCGCLLGFFGYLKLPGGAEMAYSEMGFVTASGKRVEGEGVVPDVQVPITLASLRTPRDWTLEAGVRVLEEKIRK